MIVADIAFKIIEQCTSDKTESGSRPVAPFYFVSVPRVPDKIKRLFHNETVSCKFGVIS